MENDKKLDKMIGRTFQNVPREIPSHNFTENVMSRIAVARSTKISSYTPPIAVHIWYLLALVVGVVFLYIVFGEGPDANFWPTTTAMEWLSNLRVFDMLPIFRISDTMMYGIIGFTFFLGIQIFLLKHHFARRYRLH